MQAKVRGQKWLWVAAKEYYLGPDGQESRDLIPGVQTVPGAWWTCDPETREGHLVLLYRKTPKADIRYLIRAASDAYWIGDKPEAAAKGWTYGCDYEVLVRFASPITLADCKNEPRLSDWNALRQNFQHKCFTVDEVHWAVLLKLVDRKSHP